MNTISILIDRLADLEEREGRLGSIVGLLGLAALTIAGMALVWLGISITMYGITEMINRIFF